MIDLLSLALDGVFLFFSATVVLCVGWAVWLAVTGRSPSDFLDDGCEDVAGSCDEWQRWRDAVGEVVRRG